MPLPENPIHTPVSRRERELLKDPGRCARANALDSWPASVFPVKSGIRRIPGTGEPSFGRTFRIPAGAGKTIAGALGRPDAIALVRARASRKSRCRHTPAHPELVERAAPYFNPVGVFPPAGTR